MMAALIFPMTIISRCLAVFEIDLRSLGCFRIAVAAVVLLDLVWRAQDMEALYGANGVLPPAVASTLWDWRTVYSPFTLLSASPALLWAGFAATAMGAVLLMLGIAPRFAAALTWFLLASLQNRNPPLYMVGDRFLLLLLMWCVLLPTGARFSLRPAPAGVTRLRSWAAAGLIVQLIAAYVLTGAKKTGVEWFDGTALWYALNGPDNVRELGRWLLEYPSLTVPLSHAVKWGETLAPLLMLSPWRNSMCRLAAVGFFWAFHLGVEATMQIGIFQFVGMAAWIAALPPLFWRWLPARNKESRLTFAVQHAPVGFACKLDLAAIGLLLYMTVQLGFNVTGVVRTGVPDPGPRWINAIAHTLHFQEGWAMYMRVPRQRRWLVVPGRLVDDSMIDALRGAPLQWTKPANFQSVQGGFRWTHYLNNAIVKASYEPRMVATHEPLLDYFCRRWNERQDGTRKLQQVELHLITETIPEPGYPGVPPPIDFAMAKRECRD